MAISLFDLFKVGIGPSSSHTVGPMLAAQAFVQQLSQSGQLTQISNIYCQLYGSLGATGKGHGTGDAVLMGLEGSLPETIDPDSVSTRVAAITQQGTIALLEQHSIDFSVAEDLVFHRRESLDFHANGMKLQAYDKQKQCLLEKVYYSIGGGFVVQEDENGEIQIVEDTTKLPFAFHSCAELLTLCAKHNMTIAQLMLENEKVWRTETEIRQGILSIWQTMKACIDKGTRTEGILPGGLKVKRRAAGLYQDLKQKTGMDMITPSLGAVLV